MARRADTEAGHGTGRRHADGPDVVDDRSRRPAGEELLEPVDRVGRALGHAPHAAVELVGDPTRDAQVRRPADDPVSEADALDPALHGRIQTDRRRSRWIAHRDPRRRPPAPRTVRPGHTLADPAGAL